MRSYLLKFTLIISVLNIICWDVLAEDFQIKHADSLEADKEQIFIKGNVLINYKDAILEAPLGSIESDSNGEPSKAIFTGRAKLKLKDRKIEADKITISINNKTIYAEGNTISQLKDKKNNFIIINSDFQELYWNGEDANAMGNMKTSYIDTMVNSDEAKIIYKNKKPNQAVFYSNNNESANLVQPTNITSAKEFIFDINTRDFEAIGNVISTIWPDKTKPAAEQDPILLNTDNLFIDNASGIITAKSKHNNKVKLSYQETKGESLETYLHRNKATGKPEKIIFKGNANVTQNDKELSSEEVIFNFADKKLTSNTQTNIRPKTVIFKND